MSRLFVVFSFFLFCSTLLAQENVIDKRDVPRGFYAGLTTGNVYFLDSQDRQIFKDGWLVGVVAGYDVFKYLTLEGQFKFSGHNSSPKGQAGIPTSFFAYQTAGVIRGGYPITRRITLFADLGGGVWYTNPNQKAVVGNAYRGMLTGGLGIQYFLKIRGLAMGVDPSLSVIRDMKGPVLQATGYLRYTF